MNVFWSFLPKISEFKDISHHKIMMETDNDIISKLKFIGKIGKGEKINVKNMYVQPDSLATKISRSLINFDSRDNAFNFIQNVVKRSFELVNSHLFNKSQTDLIICNNLIKDLKESKNGISNLKETYADDVMFCCKLETLLEEIDTKLIDIESKNKFENESKKEERNIKTKS
jgi:ribosome-binding ATPase YchF (GTP1/OBG family)